LLLYSSYLSLGVPNWTVLYIINTVPHHLPGWGIAPRAISIDSTAISIAAADSHDEEGVVLPRG
jgi:hypothetical protein